ncbi:hypothetical protein EV361DRAFT_874039, partial [Lentinula raphanica]
MKTWLYLIIWSNITYSPPSLGIKAGWTLNMSFHTALEVIGIGHATMTVVLGNHTQIKPVGRTQNIQVHDAHDTIDIRLNVHHGDIYHYTLIDYKTAIVMTFTLYKAPLVCFFRVSRVQPGFGSGSIDGSGRLQYLEPGTRPANPAQVAGLLVLTTFYILKRSVLLNIPIRKSDSTTSTSSAMGKRTAAPSGSGKAKKRQKKTPTEDTPTTNDDENNTDDDEIVDSTEEIKAAKEAIKKQL